MDIIVLRLHHKIRHCSTTNRKSGHYVETVQSKIEIADWLGVRLRIGQNEIRLRFPSPLLPTHIPLGSTGWKEGRVAGMSGSMPIREVQLGDQTK